MDHLVTIISMVGGHRMGCDGHGLKLFVTKSAFVWKINVPAADQH